MTDTTLKTLDELAADFANLKTTLHADLEADGVSYSIMANGLEHMAEILADTLPDDGKPYVATVDGIGRIAFTSSGTYWEIL